MNTYRIPEDSIFYSRDTSCKQGVMEATNGNGVDVALNPLAGDQLRATWECMAPFGRFVEIGKRDITSNMNLEMSRPYMNSLHQKRRQRFVLWEVGSSWGNWSLCLQLVTWYW